LQVRALPGSPKSSNSDNKLELEGSQKTETTFACGTDLGPLEQAARPDGQGCGSLVVCVCTCQRPALLARCLESLGAQVIPDGVAISLIVVDNTPDRAARLTVAQFCVTAPFQVYYVHEPEHGCARNAALNKAVALGADRIAMLDDDEQTAPDWRVLASGRRRFKQLALRGVNRLAGVTISERASRSSPCWIAALLILGLANTPMFPAAFATPMATEQSATESFAGLTNAEFEAAVKAAMPLPVLRTHRWKELGRNQYAIDMSLAGVPDAPTPAMHVVFHTAENSGCAEQIEAINAAGRYARAYVARLERVVRP
jgi:hypothetical protein